MIRPKQRPNFVRKASDETSEIGCPLLLRRESGAVRIAARHFGHVTRASALKASARSGTC